MNSVSSFGGPSSSNMATTSRRFVLISSIVSPCECAPDGDSGGKKRAAERSRIVAQVEETRGNGDLVIGRKKMPQSEKPLEIRGFVEWLGAGSNRRHQDFQSCALPTELPSQPEHEFSHAWGRRIITAGFGFATVNARGFFVLTDITSGTLMLTRNRRMGSPQKRNWIEHLTYDRIHALKQLSLEPV